MHREREDRAHGAPEAIRPGALTALLHEVAREPAPEQSPQDVPALAPGLRLGRFALVQEIGRGGFAVVWEARDVELDRPVALKLLRPRAGAPEPDERLLNEAEAAARLAHPNVVTLFDAGRSELGPYLVLELLRGETLAQRLDAGPVAPREALRIATEIAKGLAHAHARGIVHRDLKPGNVFLCEDGQVKIMDLGLAHAFGRPRLDGGTPGFMAPEQRRGAPEDERSDVFALGVILYRMLAGELPSSDGGPQAPRLDVPATPSLPALVARMLASDPVERPRDAGEILPRLATCLRELDATPEIARASVVRLRRRWFVAAAAAAALLVASGAHVLRDRSAPVPLQAAAVRRASIVVLPFADLSPGRDHRHFSQGIAEEIRNTLTGVEGLRVIGRTSSLVFEGKDEDARSIGGRLGVEAVLEGSVRKAGSRARIAVELVRAKDGVQTWSATYDRELTDVFAVQAEIARDVVATVGVRMRTGALAAVPERPVTSPEAYDAYLLGNHRADEGSPDRLASEVYERAVALDPSYAPAWAALSSVLVQWTHYVAESSTQRAARIGRALDAAEKAIAAGPHLPDGYEARARVRWVFQWNWAGAREDLERALALAPSRPSAHRHYGALLDLLGEPEKAREHARAAVDLDPFDFRSLNNLVASELSGGRLEAARRAAQRLMDADSHGNVTNSTLGELALVDGRPAEALAIFKRNRVEWRRLLGEVLAQHALGNDRDSRASLAELTATYGEARPFAVATGHAWRGERDAAFAWAERAVAERDPAAALDIRYVLLRDLFPDPRYPAMLRRMGLPAPGER